ncbi:MAG: arsenate reductase ArsC [Chloroflexi bacterium]|nr:arsenate reductase ArsC [Chloroflexota bacterium]
MMQTNRLRVLFICTGNSARSQMAEAMLRTLSGGRIDVFSAGSAPRPEIHPLARRVMLEKYNLDMAGQHPKPIEQYIGQHFDYIIAVCNKAAEACPVFPGDPERINWFYDDPAAATGTEEQRYRAFEKVAREMMLRLRTWLELPAIANRVKAIQAA